MNRIEYFPLVTEKGEVIGKAARSECHSGSFLLHPVIHLHVFNKQGEIYLQKRAMNKDTQPGKWDTSVGGHVDYGEEIELALKREAKEELGIVDFEPSFVTQYKFTSEIESELVHCFYTLYNKEIFPDPTEISEGRFWKLSEIEVQLGSNVFTPNFEQEYSTILKNLKLI
jgi:isopentenyldiphosphate isomerase